MEDKENSNVVAFPIDKINRIINEQKNIPQKPINNFPEDALHELMELKIAEACDLIKNKNIEIEIREALAILVKSQLTIMHVIKDNK